MFISKKELNKLKWRIDDLELRCQIHEQREARLDSMFSILPPHIERKIEAMNNQYYASFAHNNRRVDIREIVKMLLDFLDLEVTSIPAQDSKLVIQLANIQEQQ